MYITVCNRCTNVLERHFGDTNILQRHFGILFLVSSYVCQCMLIIREQLR